MNLPVDFDEQFYLYANPDVEQAVKNGYIISGAAHYLEFGYKDNPLRVYKPILPENFNEELYLDLNPDVKQAIESKRIQSGSRHWLIQGWKEGRAYQYTSQPDNPEEVPRTVIVGDHIASAEQMATFLLKTNQHPKLMGMNPLEFCRIYLEEGMSEDIKGDIAFCQSIHETGWFAFTGNIVPEQMNYAGIGRGVKVHYFSSQREGIRAQIQHLKAHATAEALNLACIDPSYDSVMLRGKAPTVEELGGKWAVPGYEKTKFNSFDEAYEAGQTYGQIILDLYSKLLNTQVDYDLIAPLQPITEAYKPKMPKDAKSEFVETIGQIDKLVHKAKALLNQIKWK